MTLDLDKLKALCDAAAPSREFMASELEGMKCETRECHGLATPWPYPNNLPLPARPCPS
jgi:hypothetical protein